MGAKAQTKAGLLPQPGGFEGFGLTAAGAPPNDSLVTPLGEDPAHLLDHGRGAVHAVRPMRADARGAEGPVAKLVNLIEAEAEVRKGTKEVLPPLPHAVVSVIVATDSREQWLDLAIRVVERDEHVKVVPGEGIKGPVRKLDVLLRHRPPSISARSTLRQMASAELSRRCREGGPLPTFVRDGRTAAAPVLCDGVRVE